MNESGQLAMTIVLAMLGSGAVTAVVTSVLNHRASAANTQKVEAEAMSAHAASAKTWMEAIALSAGDATSARREAIAARKEAASARTQAIAARQDALKAVAKAERLERSERLHRRRWTLALPVMEKCSDEVPTLRDALEAIRKMNHLAEIDDVRRE